MKLLMRLLVPDGALTWRHECVAWRFSSHKCEWVYMYGGGLDVGYVTNHRDVVAALL